MKVYVVTSGSFSDTVISGIFSDKEKAEEFIATKRSIRDSDINGYSEYELDKFYEPDDVFANLDTSTGRITFETFSWYEMGYCDGIFTCKVHFNVNKDAMEKSVYDKCAAWKAVREL